MDSTDLPAWLLATDDYRPRADREAFLDRSIRSLLGLLSRLRAFPVRGDTREGPLKALSAFLLILVLSLSRKPSFVAAFLVAVLVVLAIQDARSIGRVLAAALPVSLFTSLALLPSAIGGNLSPSLLLTAKVFCSVSVVLLLAGWLGPGALFDSLRFLFVPALFVLVLDLTLRYLGILGEASLNTLEAVKLRSVGRNSRKMAALSGATGALFLKSRAMSEDLVAAMRLRGFTGDYVRPRSLGRPWAVCAISLLDLSVILIQFAMPGP